MNRKFLTAVLLCAFLTGCGVKPGSVSSPSGDANDTFPSTYPNPKHDPQPDTE